MGGRTATGKDEREREEKRRKTTHPPTHPPTRYLGDVPKGVHGHDLVVRPPG